MSSHAIKVENLGKRYIIGHQREKGSGLRHTLEDAVRSPLAWLRRRKESAARTREEFWALKDISFEIGAGEVLGLIGRNGAGKSTLLKVLSRITEPTSGRISLKGRVASLLEVGTGFHQELTGRENIFLNGAILGMTRSEIKQRFDEIVAFSEVEQFLDTPVKRYSSGMYVRLAFAVAAHLEPDILIVDEVLAVGDAQFQTKCLGKMEDVASSQGRTILFVSHNMGVINRLCQKAILLDRGKVEAIGETNKVVTSYLSTGSDTVGRRVWTKAAPEFARHVVRPLDIQVLNEADEQAGHVAMTRPFIVQFAFEVHRRLPLFRIALRFFTGDGTLAFTTADSASADYAKKPYEPGTYVCRCEIPANLMNEGRYHITVSGDIPLERVIFHEENAISFTVDQTGGPSARYSEKWPGAVCPRLNWSVKHVHVSQELDVTFDHSC